MLIPDAVEPYIGYKWLHVENKTQLFSVFAHTVWEPFTPLEAQCKVDWGYGWRPRKTHQAQRAHKGDYENQLVTLANGTSEYRAVRTWWIDDVQLDAKPKKPKIVLPPGLAWSYEKKPIPHDAVSDECVCGIYVGTEEEARHYARPGPGVLTKVALWGRVIRGTKGARGQYAYPQEIISGKVKNLDEIREAYGIPIQGEENNQPSVALTGVGFHTDNVRVTLLELADNTSAPKRKRRLW